MAGRGASPGLPQYKESIYKPYDWKSNPYYKSLQNQSLNVQSPQMLSKFMNEWDPMMDYFKSGLEGINTNAGLGQYGSDLLDLMTGKVTANLNDPKSALAYGKTMDRLEGQGNAARQSLADEFAGWGRGAGVRPAAMAALEGTLRKEKADAARQTAMEAERNAMQDSFNLEGMKGGFFENSKNRELSNADLQRNLFATGMSGMSSMFGPLAQMMQWQGGQDVSADTQNQQFKNNLANQMFNLYGSQEPAYQQQMNEYKNKVGQQQWTQQNFPQTYGNISDFGGPPKWSLAQGGKSYNTRGYI